MRDAKFRFMVRATVVSLLTITVLLVATVSFVKNDTDEQNVGESSSSTESLRNIDVNRDTSPIEGAGIMQVAPVNSRDITVKDVTLTISVVFIVVVSIAAAVVDVIRKRDDPIRKWTKRN